MHITVVGAGNMGLCLVGHLSKSDNEVTLFTSSNKLIGKKLYITESEKGITQEVRDFKVTSSVAEAFSNSDVIFCTYPAFLRKEFVKKIEDIVPSRALLCFVPGYGGAEYFCSKLLQRGVTICGFQRVPYVARYESNQDSVVANILSSKKELFIATIPQKQVKEVAAIIELLLNIPTIPLKEYLSVTLSPSNPLLHISGLYNVFKNADINTNFHKPLKFYEEWNDDTSDLLMNYDKELHMICDAMKPYFTLEEVVPLSVYYESPTARAMTHKLKSIEAFKVVNVPLQKKGEKEFVVDINSRMFVEDFPYGVCMFKAMAIMMGVKTPIIDNLLDFYERLSKKHYFNKDGSFGLDIAETGVPQLHNIKSINELSDFYLGIISSAIYG